jgi:hypothetical protein
VEYVLAALLIASPWLFGFAQLSPKALVPVLAGLVTALQCVSTDFELGIFRVLTFPRHLALDLGCGAFVAMSPWFFDFAESVWLPHLVLGLVQVAAAMTTRRYPAEDPPLRRAPAL